MRFGTGALTLGILIGVLAACSSAPDTPLAAAGRTDQVLALLAQGHNPNEKERHGWTPIMRAARYGRIDTIRVLLEKGADPNLNDTGINGWTPLMHAIHTRQYQAVRVLLDAAADVNRKTKGGVTALMMAVLDGNPGLVRDLLAKGADPYTEASDGVTAFTVAVSGGAFMDIDKPLIGGCQTEIAKILLEGAPDLALKKNRAGRTARWFAKLKGCSEVMALIEKQDRPEASVATKP